MCTQKSMQIVKSTVLCTCMFIICSGWNFRGFPSHCDTNWKLRQQTGENIVDAKHSHHISEFVSSTQQTTMSLCLHSRPQVVHHRSRDSFSSHGWSCCSSSKTSWVKLVPVMTTRGQRETASVLQSSHPAAGQKSLSCRTTVLWIQNWCQSKTSQLYETTQGGSTQMIHEYYFLNSNYLL